MSVVGLQRRSGFVAVRAGAIAWALVGACTAVRIFFSFYRLSVPGLHYDEVSFVDAATIRLPGLFIDKTLHNFLFLHSQHGIPLATFPYVGALKPWIYAPIFSIFGESAMSIRLPVELITLAGLLLIYPALRDLINRPVALLAFAALCFDNSLFWLSRDDVGPTALELFFKCASLYCAARFSRTGSRRWVALGLVTLGLGLFNKLNFIWVVDAFVLASVVTALVHRDKLASRRGAVALWVLGLIVLYGCFLAYYIHNNIGALDGTSDPFKVLPYTWPQYLNGIKLVLSGTWFYAYALSPIGPRMVVVWLVVMLFVVGTVFSVLRRRRSLPVALLALVTVAMSVQTLLTYDATAGWHYVSVYPYVTAVASYGAWALLTSVVGDRRRLIAASMSVVLMGAVTYDGVLMAKYYRQLKHEPSNAAWSPAIYTLSRYLQRQPGTVFTADWGIYTQLFALHPSTRWNPLEYELASSSQAQAAASQVAAAPGPKLIVTHVRDKQLFAGNDGRLAQVMGGHLHLLRILEGDDHTPVYAVYSYR